MPPAPHNTVPTTPSIRVPDINELYAIESNMCLGTGAFSRVVPAYNKKEVGPDGQPVRRALKVMDIKGLVGKKAAMVMHEKEILRRTNHPSIVKLHQFVQTGEHVFFELDLMGTDLFEYIVQVKRMKEDDTARVMQQLLSAVAYLHGNDIVHRDIKPENILINSPADVKLADFGLAKVVEGANVNNTPCGTSYYIAPEVIRSIEEQGGLPLTTTVDRVKMIDMWSCGVVMFVLLAGRPPFSGQVKTSDDRRTLLRRIDRGLLFPPEKGWADVCDDAKDLIEHLLQRDVGTRITAADALKHPFFTKRGLSLIPATAPQKTAPAAPSPADVEAAAAVDGARSRRQATADALDAEYIDVKRELEAIQSDLLHDGDAEGEKSAHQQAELKATPAGPSNSVKQKKAVGLPGMKK